ncbi:hypothetical protein ASE63_01480 [Bosea sp. Root381]|nr:hypothetical protein ASE63_01480 [Bosea sp. Root381]
MIDPGHGGHATIPGDSTWNNAVGPAGTLEKTLTLDLGIAVAERLHAAGHSVLLTRDSDVNLRLRDRAKVARESLADAFVSIHFNGSRGHDAQGSETLVHLNYSTRSAELSLAVQDAVLRATQLDDRNTSFDRRRRIKPQSLGVLNPAYHAANTAACLLEVSFLDRADEEQRLKAPAYRAAIAQAIADGIEAYTGKATTRVPVAVADLGDAIEVAVANEPGINSPEMLLGLDKAEWAAGPDDGTADPDEEVRMPPKAFSQAFVLGNGPAFALLPRDKDWPLLDEFVGFIAALRLDHFQPDEFLEFGGMNGSGKCKGKNDFPPKDLWENIRHTAKMLDAIRADIGAPVRILSCYRAPAYNDCVRGESRSLHMEFNAIDFTCAVGTPETWRRIAAKLRDKHTDFTGGIGVYPERHFVHIDTRRRVANWRGR